MEVKTVSIVDVKPSIQSKINWTQIVSMASVGATLAFGERFALSPEVQGALIVVISWGFNLVTIVIKTWFTPTVTPQSAPTPVKVVAGSDLVVAAKPEV